MRRKIVALAIALALLSPLVGYCQGDGIFGLGLGIGIRGEVNYEGFKHSLTNKTGTVSERTKWDETLAVDSELSTNRLGELGITLLYGIPSTIFQVGLDGYYIWEDALYVDELKTAETDDWLDPIYKWEHQDRFGTMVKLRTFVWRDDRMGFFIDLDVPFEWTTRPLDRQEELYTKTSREFTTGFSIVPGFSFVVTDFLQAFGRVEFVSFDYRYSTKSKGFYFDKTTMEETQKPMVVDKQERHSAKFRFQTAKTLSDLLAVKLGMLFTL